MFDKSFLINPLYEYIKWLFIKFKYQYKYRRSKLRIEYGAFLHNCTFGKYNWIGKNNSLVNVDIDDFSYVASDSVIANCKIGKFCSIASNVKIAPGKHPTSKFVSTHPVTFSNPHFMAKRFINDVTFVSNSRVIIGNDVWVGANCLIVDGVEIADGAIIAANSVVSKNVGPYEIVGGVPAKLIKKRFEDDQIAALLEFQWWNKKEEWMEKNIGDFNDISLFLKKNRPDVASN